MPSKRSTKTPSPPGPSVHSVLGTAWKEALILFLGFSAFGILFNAFYSDGIELKVSPKRKAPAPSVQTPVAYAGMKDPRLPPKGKTPASPKTPTVQAPSDNIPRLSLGGAYSRFLKKSAVFLDARKPEEYQEGHIPGALNFFGNEIDAFLPQVMPQLPDKDREIVAYCHGGDCDLSLQVAQALIVQGYSRVEIFQDGWPAWVKAAYPVAKGAQP